MNIYGTRCINGEAQRVRYKDRQRFALRPRVTSVFNEVTQADVKLAASPTATARPKQASYTKQAYIPGGALDSPFRTPLRYLPVSGHLELAKQSTLNTRLLGDQAQEKGGGFP